MKIYKTRAFGIGVMVFLIAAGSLAGGYNGLDEQYREVEKVFINGEYDDGVCIQNDLNERIDCAANMTTIAGRYVSQESELEDAIDDLRDASGDLSSEKDIDDKYEDNQELEYAMDAVYNILGGCTLSDTDKTYREKLYAEFNSRGDTISHDSYNTKAAEYNLLIDRFPANVIVALTPAHKAELFY